MTNPRTFTVRQDDLKDRYGAGTLSAQSTRLMVEGQQGVGFGVGCVMHGVSAWKRQGDPERTPGPWAYAYGLPAIMDDTGTGTSHEIEEARRDGYLIECSVGDRLVIDGEAYEVRWHEYAKGRYDRANVDLVGPLPKEAPGPQQVTVTVQLTLTVDGLEAPLEAGDRATVAAHVLNAVEDWASEEGYFEVELNAAGGEAAAFEVIAVQVTDPAITDPAAIIDRG